MALSAELETLVASITDEKVREATRKQLTENMENGLRQEDYSRKMNAASQAQKVADDKYKANLDWFAEKETALKEVDTLRTETASMRDKVAELERIKAATRGTLTDTEERDLDAELRTARSELNTTTKELTTLKTQVAQINDKLAKGELLTRADFDKEGVESLNRFGAAMFKVIDKERDHLATFGKPIDRDVLIAEANKRKGDVDAAYEFLTKADREALLRTNIEKEFDEKYQAKLRGLNLPMDTGSGEPSLGPLQSRLRAGDDAKENAIDPKVPADGSGRLSALIGQELRAEGKY